MLAGLYQLSEPGGRGRGGLDLSSSLEAKFRVRSPNKRNNLGSSGTTRGKNWDIIPGKRILFICLDVTLNVTREYTAHENSQISTTQILGSYLKFKGQNLGYLSSIFLEVKFGALTRISEADFGAKPPDCLIWKCPLGIRANVTPIYANHLSVKNTLM